MAQCYFCGTAIPEQKKIYRNTTCDSCGKPLKVCRNCKFYDKDAPHACLEHITDPVQDKENANFCEFFVLDSRNNASGTLNKKNHAMAINAFNSLFSD